MSIRATQRFYNKCVTWGIDLSGFEPNNYRFDLPKPKGTFKRRANQIKDIYNHKFNSLHNYPNIDIIIFEPKN